MSAYFVFLRRPGSLNDRRDDPFWEFGSFGSTGCHNKNLLHPKTTTLNDGDRLVFIQGGDGELRIVALTPPIRVHGDSERVEALWPSKFCPLPYVEAPLLIDNRDLTDFPAIHRVLNLRSTQRTTPCGKVASRLRSRKVPIPTELALQIEAWFEQKSSSRAVRYIDVVAPKGTRWHAHAEAEAWHEINRRKQRYAELKALPRDDQYPSLKRRC